MLCVAPNGARRTHADHPALPVTPAELAREAAACCEAGASVIHLHVRDAQARHSLDAAHYRAATAAIERAVADRMLVQVTTESVGLYAPAQQMALVRELRPAAASVALRELAPDAAGLDAALPFFAWAVRERVALQFILYAPQEVRCLVGLARKGLLAQQAPNVLFVLGRYAVGQQSSPSDLLPFLAEWPAEWPWSVCAFGAAEACCMAAAIGLGGHVRVGFENNLHRTDGELASGNAELVNNVAALARFAGRAPASAAEARSIYGASGR